MTKNIRSVPLQQYIAERTGILSSEQVSRYIEELSTNEEVVESVLVGADRDASMLLSPQVQIDHAHVASGHALNFLQRNALPDKGLQDLLDAQYKFAKAKLEWDRKNTLNWFQRLVRRYR